jgi:hypothetical protein
LNSSLHAIAAEGNVLFLDLCSGIARVTVWSPC